MKLVQLIKKHNELFEGILLDGTVVEISKQLDLWMIMKIGKENEVVSFHETSEKALKSFEVKGFKIKNEITEIKQSIRELEKKGHVFFPLNDTELLSEFGNAGDLKKEIENSAINDSWEM